jgi:hypothetical protein
MVYCHIPDDLRSKLDAKTERGILIGMSLVAKKYAVLIDGVQRVRRDVIIDEGTPGFPILYNDDDDDGPFIGPGHTSDSPDP